MDDLTFELAENILASQPFSVLLGTRLTAFGGGGATLELDIRHRRGGESLDSRA